MIKFILGFLLGGFIGILLMACVKVGGRNDKN